MSDTPLTDAAAIGFARILVDHTKHTTTELVEANFARRLERDRAELISAMENMLLDSSDKFTQRYRAEARALLARLK